MKRREEKFQELLEQFEPDLSSCRNPQEVLKVLDLTRKGLRSQDIAEQIGKSAKAIQKIWRRYNFPCFQNVVCRLEEEQPMWNGGMKICKGYLYKRCQNHPNKSKHGGYVAVHRLVIEEKIGRFLLPTEVVDHIDGDTLNNSPENLRIFESNSAHLRETLKGKRPNWSEDGKKRLEVSRRQRRRTWKGRVIPSNQTG